MNRLKHMEPGKYYLDWYKGIVEVVYTDDSLQEASYIDPYDPDSRSHCDYRHFSIVDEKGGEHHD